ncbi:hypothetical protein JKP88DRAFT_274247 [Tribonema minus]|uniref:Uncharacterized protein n=1 Tax=Tribonema minus TaxID=303371 RepID=A0A835YJ36_9STRA|nr:hypothetical protein JKP88DRAFT_274247 [Tribonema minus]
MASRKPTRSPVVGSDLHRQPAKRQAVASASQKTAGGVAGLEQLPVAGLECLPDGALLHVFSFLGKGHHLYVAASTRLRELYRQCHQQHGWAEPATSFTSVLASPARLSYAVKIAQLKMSKDERRRLLRTPRKAPFMDNFNFCRSAGRCASTDVLRLARHLGMPIGWAVCSGAVRRGREDAVRWLQHQSPDAAGAQLLLGFAAERGDLPWLQDMWQKLVTADASWRLEELQRVSTPAAQHGHAHVLRWLLCDARFAVLKSASAPAATDMLTMRSSLWPEAALAGHGALVRWLCEPTGVTCPPRSCANFYMQLATAGQLPLLQWLDKRFALGAHLSAEVNAGAFAQIAATLALSKRTPLPAFAWLRAITGAASWPPDMLRELLHNACCTNNLELCEWLLRRGAPWPDPIHATSLNLLWPLEALQWAHARGRPWFSWDAHVCTRLAQRGTRRHTAIRDWAHRAGCPCGCAPSTADAA